MEFSDKLCAKSRLTATVVWRQRALKTSPKHPTPIRGPSSTSLKSTSASSVDDVSSLREEFAAEVKDAGESDPSP